jgi:small multidrug resistance family-3 protein
MSWILGIIGRFVLFVYGIIPTFQSSHFHQTYAAYGGVFIIMAMVWAGYLKGLFQMYLTLLMQLLQLLEW